MSRQFSRLSTAVEDDHLQKDHEQFDELLELDNKEQEIIHDMMNQDKKEEASKRTYSRLYTALAGFIYNGDDQIGTFDYDKNMTDEEVLQQLIDEDVLESVDGLTLVRKPETGGSDYYHFSITGDPEKDLSLMVYKYY